MIGEIAWCCKCQRIRVELSRGVVGMGVNRGPEGHSHLGVMDDRVIDDGESESRLLDGHLHSQSRLLQTGRVPPGQ